MESGRPDSCVVWQRLSRTEKQKLSGEPIEGRIGYKEEGENGFGYDPIFYVPEYGCTTASMSSETKNAISHRGKALQLIKPVIGAYHLIQRGYNESTSCQ